MLQRSLGSQLFTATALCGLLGCWKLRFSPFLLQPWAWRFYCSLTQHTCPLSSLLHHWTCLFLIEIVISTRSSLGKHTLQVLQIFEMLMGSLFARNYSALLIHDTLGSSCLPKLWFSNVNFINIFVRTFFLKNSKQIPFFSKHKS